MKDAILPSIVLLFLTSLARGIPNPAAVYCTELGYDCQIRTDEHGNQYGVCVFPDGSECGQWAFFHKCYLGDASADCHWPCEELPCKRAGESVLLGECCPGLVTIQPAGTFDIDCNDLAMVGWVFLCSDCGNGICESWESKCNCPADCAEARIIYVDADATGTNDGSSWVDAYKYLQDALADANSAQKPVEVRAAQGVYKPDQGAGITPGDRMATFQLKNGVAVRGGYAGSGEPNSDARDIDVHETILSGDLNGDDADVNDPCDSANDPTRAENCYHVTTGSGTEPNAILDGFTISGGNAEPPLSYSEWGDCQDCSGGGGMCNVSGSPTVANCIFSGNFAGDGAGMYNENSSPNLTNCAFSKNLADKECEPVTMDIVVCWGGYGGGMYNEGGGPTLTNCRFNNNLASRAGGGIYNKGCYSVLTDCTFTNNRAGDSGGGIDNRNWTELRLTDCMFTGNSAHSGGGMGNHTGSLTLTNCVFSRNSAKWAGGGMADYYGSSILIACRLTNNWADYYGGGMYNWDSSAILTECTFNGNLTPRRRGARWIGGGGMYIYNNSSPKLVNCTFVGNWGENGRALRCYSYRHPNNLELVNCILWDGGDEVSNADGSVVTITYSDVQGGRAGVYDPCEGVVWGYGNIDHDPCFANPGRWVSVDDPNQTVEPNHPNASWIDGDYHLKSQAGRWDSQSRSWVQDDVTSPCIDAGDPSSPVGQEPFPNGGIINMGAYGGTAEASKSYFGEPVCQTIVAGDINGDCKVDFIDFNIMALHWLEDNSP